MNFWSISWSHRTDWMGMKTPCLGAHSGSLKKTLVAQTHNLGAPGARAPVRQQPWPCQAWVAVYISNYYSFKIFPRFWLVKSTRIIHHSQLLLPKFGKNLCHIEAMTSKVQPAADYWTNDVKMTSKVQPAAHYWTVDRENLGTRLCYFWWAEKQQAKWRNSFKNGEIEQSLKSAFVGYEEFCRFRRVSSTSAFGLCG